MKNLYNKGRFRGYEYGKIPPYMKKIGNRKWRSTVQKELENELSTDSMTKVQLLQKKSKKKLRIKVKITLLDQGKKYSRYCTYPSEKQLRDSSKRNNVINVVFK